VLSAFLGIAVGDIVWLQALQSLGARKLILVDSVKPFCGALFAWMFLGEEMRPTSALGILVRLCVCVLAGLRARVLSHAYVRVVLCACLLESIPGN
jgi:drug/metabolite transporter (DMT)-like permease